MANKHYKVDEEFEVTVTFKVKLKEISNYHPLSEEEIKNQLVSVKPEIEEFIRHKVENEYYCEELTHGVDYWAFNIEKVKDER